jgi:AraC family transcriptional regulator of adaptative response / methylphosphotriester-DNA alkyltransferase methyltransferase
MVLTDNERWDAVVRCDESYDDKFLYGVKTSGVFCKPSCKAREPHRKNVAFFDGLEEAYASSLRPCKKCRPDLLDEKLVVELTHKAKDIYDSCFDNNNKLLLLIKELNISQNRFARLFEQQFAVTPKEYINKLRIDKTIKLLADPNMRLLKIAALCGFSSLSAFTNLFKKQVGCTPDVYRKTKI